MPQLVEQLGTLLHDSHEGDGTFADLLEIGLQKSAEEPLRVWKNAGL
jgi:hypothetical protein